MLCVSVPERKDVAFFKVVHEFIDDMPEEEKQWHLEFFESVWDYYIELSAKIRTETEALLYERLESFIDSWIRGPHKREVDSVEAEFAG